MDLYLTQENLRVSESFRIFFGVSLSVVSFSLPASLFALIDEVGRTSMKTYMKRHGSASGAQSCV